MSLGGNSACKPGCGSYQLVLKVRLNHHQVCE
jgi:hypothetical protein